MLIHIYCREYTCNGYIYLECNIPVSGGNALNVQLLILNAFGTSIIIQDLKYYTSVVLLYQLVNQY